MKPYYADYVNHILRFYFRYNKSKGFKNDVDKTNYIAADKVVQRLTDNEKSVLGTIFTEDNTNLGECVSLASRLHAWEVQQIWTLISTVTVKIAKERRLL